MALIHHWKFDESDEEGGAADSVGGNHLTLVGASLPVVTDGPFGRARQFPASNANYFEGTLTLWLAMMAEVDFTVAFWIRRHNTDGGLNVVTHVGRDDGGSYQGRGDINNQYGSGYSFTYNYAGTATATLQDPTATETYDTPFGGWIHVTLRAQVAAGTHTMKPYFMGTVYGAASTLESTREPYEPDPVDGSPPPPNVFYVGKRRVTSGNGTEVFAHDYDICDLRIYDHALTDAEVFALAFPFSAGGASGGESGGFPDTTAPVISNVTPAAGTPMGRHDAWGFRVTDNVGFRRTMVWVTFFDRTGRKRGKEVIWDGSEFSPEWSSGTRTEVEAGKEYDFASIRRNGGIPAHIADVAFDVAAIDTAGNEGT